jgi:transposase
MRLKYCRLSDKKHRQLLEYFVLKVTARTAASLKKTQANMAALFYRKVRMIIAEKLETEASEFSGKIELEENCFGGVRKGKRGRGTAGKFPVFGILKRGLQIIDNTKTDTLMPIIRQKIKPDSVVYTDSFRSYNGI